ncbi:MAG: helix-turn-helix domain-containing protein [bacterium]
MKIHIRNMACESCKVVVKEALEDLNLKPTKIDLGEASIEKKISEKQKEKLSAEINKVGLELIESKEAILIEKIRKSIIQYLNSPKSATVNFSDYLTKKLNYDYSYLSNLFTEVEATTITHYINAIKMERAKEMILFEDNTLSEIAEKLHYNNLSSFSSQFKKTTGFTPSHFKRLKERRRKTMQKLSQQEEKSKKQ